MDLDGPATVSVLGCLHMLQLLGCVLLLLPSGKNRPLDPDELEFLDTLAQQEAEQQRRVQSQEQAELEAYRQAVAAAAEAKAAGEAEAEGGDPLAEPSRKDSEAEAGPGPGSSSGGLQAQSAVAGRKPVSSKPVLPVLKPLVKVRPKGAAADGAEQRDSKRAKLDDAAEQQPPSVGLGGLLGDYASDSD
jgi:FKBP-type peptidyl-prolyl cis-trans isomerase